MAVEADKTALANGFGREMPVIYYQFLGAKGQKSQTSNPKVSTYIFAAGTSNSPTRRASSNKERM
jgi:hypothetical protein